MKVYISLPVTGTSDYKERAEAIEKVLTDTVQYGKQKKCR